MDSKKVRKLLLKYDAGESTLDQEKALREYFQNNDVPDDLQSYRLIFAFAQKSRNQQIDRKMHLPELKKDSKYFWTAIAASVILVMGLFFFQNRPVEIYDNDLGTIQNKEEALQKSMEALRMVSQLMNEGKEDLIYLKEFNNTKNKFLITE